MEMLGRALGSPLATYCIVYCLHSSSAVHIFSSVKLAQLKVDHAFLAD